jgi:hypothetical protein
MSFLSHYFNAWHFVMNCTVVVRLVKAFVYKFRRNFALRIPDTPVTNRTTLHNYIKNIEQQIPFLTVRQHTDDTYQRKTG